MAADKSLALMACSARKVSALPDAGATLSRAGRCRHLSLSPSLRVVHGNCPPAADGDLGARPGQSRAPNHP